MDFENFVIDGESDSQKTKKAQKAWDYVKKTTKSSYNKITLTKGKTSPLQSKVGGTPYCPNGFQIPMDNIEGVEKKPMKLLAQINFEQMPKLENFPEKGILQFFISSQKDDECLGCNFDNLRDNSGFKVVFHENPDEHLNTKAISYEADDNDMFPVKDEYAMQFIRQEETLTFCDYRFEEMFLRKYNEEDGEPLFDIFDLPDKIYNEILDDANGAGHKIGGYPFFTQADPREFDNEYSDCNVLLLQIDTDEENSVAWGDSGVANFFISFKDLKNKDFSSVIYNWDCC